MRRSLVTVALTAIVAGCSGGQTQPGAIGQPLDLRQYLPDTLRGLMSNPLDTSFTRQIKVGPDSAPVEITWTAFTHGPSRYLGTVSSKLLRAVPYDSLRFGNPTNLSNDGTKDSINATATVRIDWFKRVPFSKQSGSASFKFNARGQ